MSSAPHVTNIAIMNVGLPLLLFTGVVMNLLAQAITDTNFSHPSAHILPWIKFTATLLFSVASRRRQGPAAAAPTPRQHRLMAVIGVLDAAAYVTFCIGFAICGASLASVVLGAAGQVCTALATRLVLRKRLSGGQVAAIGVVCGGLALRALPPSLLSPGAGPAPALTPEQLRGAGCVLAAAVLYSALGVTYEALVTATGKPPQYADMLWYTSRIGACPAVVGAGTQPAALWCTPARPACFCCALLCVQAGVMSMPLAVQA